MYKKIKILYAADNRLGSFYQLQRFLWATNSKNYEIKIAAYEKSMGNLYVDYTLDCLLNFSDKYDAISYNGNYKYYYNEIKRFNPDLIITDCEIFTALVALELNIKYWQCSPMLLRYVLSEDMIYNTGWTKKYEELFSKDHKRKIYENSSVLGADRKFVISNLCDITNKISLPNGYKWARPDFILQNQMPHNYSVNNGLSYPLFDAFYNQQYSFIKPNYSEYESIMQSFIYEKFGFGKITNGIISSVYNQIDISINNNIKFLHEYLGEL